MRILVTGGYGFIGSAYVRYLTRVAPEHTQIAVLDALTYAAHLRRLDSYSDYFTFYHANICNKNEVDSVFEQFMPTHVVHFAAETHVDNALKSTDPFILTNVLGTQLIIDACTQAGALLIHVSTDEVYGPTQAATAPLTETAPLAPHNPYAATKAAAEHLILAAAHARQLHYLIVRPSNNVGPYQHTEKFIPHSIDLLAHHKAIQIYGEGKERRSWIHVDDTARAIYRLMISNNRNQIYNISGREERSNLELAQAIVDVCRAAGMDIPQPAMRFVQNRAGHDFCYHTSGEKLKEALGFEPEITLNQALVNVVSNYLNQ